MAYNKKKRKNYMLWGIGILILIALMIFGSQKFSLDDLNSDSFGGATVFSIDTVQMTGKDASDTEWVLALSMNDGAESVTGEFTAEDIEKFNLKTVPASDFKVDFQLKDVSCNYNLEQEDMVVGRLHDAWVTEQCMGFNCPYEIIDLDDVIVKCQNEGGENCERMVDLDQLPNSGTHTEWCSWFPEESNVPQVGECERISEFGGRVICSFARVKNPTESFCDICYQDECNSNEFSQLAWSQYDWSTLNEDMFCCYLDSETPSMNKDNGDWRVEHIGLVPQYDVLDVSTVPIVKYNATIRVTIEETGEVIEGSITEKTKVVELGDFGSVKWAGNLVGTQFCPQPSVDNAVLQNIDNKEYKIIDNGAGSVYQSYADNLNELSRIDVDRYTFTMITDTEVIDVDPGIGGGAIFSRFTLLNNQFEEMDNMKSEEGDCVIKEDESLFSCETETSVVYPLLKLSVKASKVGLFVPDGKPEIISVSTVQSGATDPNYKEKIELDPVRLTKLYIGIKNVGSEDDSFDVSMDCPFPVSQQSSRIPVASGETGVAELVVSGDGLIQSCNVRANSVSYPENRDEEDINIVINPTCDQYGIGLTDMIFTEYGCFPQPNYPEVSCNNDEFWLSNLDKCISYDDLSTGEQRLDILEQVSQENCNKQCNGNKECTLSCLEYGNVKPICVGVGQMMTLNDYLCDFESQPNLMLPAQIQNKVWLDAPVCDYVCEWGYEGKDCSEITEDVRFTYDNRPPFAEIIKGEEVCETCFDGIKNQNEEGTDCGGICLEKYGRDKDCGKIRAPDHCYNHKVDGDEYCVTHDCVVEYGVDKPDCGGSCDFTCDEKFTGWTGNTLPMSNGMIYIIVIILLLMIGTLGYFAIKKRGKRR